MSNEKRQIYLNDAQYYFATMDARVEVAICGRGIGKGLLQAIRMLRMVQLMPRGSFGFVVPSVKRGKTNILPSILMHLVNWGYLSDVHWVAFKRPPKNLGWAEPIWKPESYDNVISFYNGSYVALISQDVTGTSNSMSLDGLIIDEAKFIDFEQLKEETFQANRGNQLYFGGCHLHHGMTITTDMPTDKKGSWVLRYEEQMDKDLRDALEGLVWQIVKTKQLKENNPEREQYYLKKLNELRSTANECRRHLTLYKEYSSLENFAILGEQFYRDCKRNLPALTFATSILGLRLRASTTGFYSGLAPDNLYTCPNLKFLDSVPMDLKHKISDDCRTDGDLIQDKPLVIGFDANDKINWCVVGQVDSYGALRILKSFYVKYQRKLPELVDDFCDYYYYKAKKDVIFYYDTTFVKNNYAWDGRGFYQGIVAKLKKKNWRVTAICIGQQMHHIEKQLLIDRMFKGTAKHRVFLNRDNNRDLLLSIELADSYNGKKDKRGEKLAETEEDKLENRTDGSDAFDTVCIGVENFPVRTLASAGGVISIGGR